MLLNQAMSFCMKYWTIITKYCHFNGFIIGLINHIENCKESIYSEHCFQFLFSHRYHRSQGTETSHRWHHRGGDTQHHRRNGMVQKCRPVHFNIRSGRKYIFYVKRVSAGRYVSVAIPDQLNRKSRKISKKLLCKNCGKL